MRLFDKIKNIFSNNHECNLRNICVKFFYAVMFFFFFFIFIFTIFYNKSSYANLSFYESIFSFFIYCFFVFLIWKFFLRKRKDNKKFYFFFLFVFFILQLSFAFLFAVRPSWDFGAVNDSVFWDLDGVMALNKNVYFYRYSNNVGLFLLLKTIYYPFSLLGVNHFLLLGIGLLFNIILIDIGLFYLYRFLCLFASSRQRMFFFFISLLYLPFITYVPIFYTDTYSLPFAIMSLYYLFYYLYCNDKKIYLLLCGFSLGIGCFIKFSLFIVFLAFLIFFLFRSEKMSLRKVFHSLFVIALFFSIPLVFLQGYIHFSFDAKLLEKESFPKEHYFMMGLTNYGGYNEKDVLFTRNILGISNKKRANLKQFYSRFNELHRTNKILEFYINKAVYTWGDGTYFAPRKLAIDPLHSFSIKNIVLGDNNYIFRCISQAQMLFTLFFILVGIFFRKYLTDRQKDIQLLLNIIIFGVFLFFLLWEARSRYIVNFIPILLCSSYLGVIALYNYLKIKYVNNLICK